MLRPLRTAFPIFLSALALLTVGCSTIYRPVYSPGESNYKKPPEKKEAELLPTTPEPSHSVTSPVLPDATAPATPPAPGMLDTPPTIPGLPN